MPKIANECISELVFLAMYERFAVCDSSNRTRLRRSFLHQHPPFCLGRRTIPWFFRKEHNPSIDGNTAPNPLYLLDAATLLQQVIIYCSGTGRLAQSPKSCMLCYVLLSGSGRERRHLPGVEDPETPHTTSGIPQSSAHCRAFACMHQLDM